MDLKTIKTFKTIVKLGSFQRAAEELNYAQSTVTMHIKSLEAELNVTLLERGKNLQLTEAGRLLHEKGDLLLKGFDSLQQAMTEIVQGESGFIRIGVMEPVASFRLPEILPLFMEKYPKIQLSVQIHSSKLLMDMVAKDEVDFAVCSAPDISLDATFYPLFQEEVVLLMAEDHRLNQQDYVSLQDLRLEEFITTSTVCPFRRNFESQMIDAGIHPRYGLEVSNMLGLKHYVQAGFGVAIVPLNTVTPPPVGTIIKPVVDFTKGLTVGLLRKNNQVQTKAVQDLMNVISEKLSVNGL